MADSESGFYYTLAHSDRVKEKEKEREQDRDRDRTGGREKERERKLNSSFHPKSPRRRNSTTTGASPGPPSRRSTFDSAMDVSGTVKRARSPALSTASDQLDRLRKDKKYCTKELPPLNRDYAPSTSHRSRSPSRDMGRDRERERADLPNKTPPARSHVADTCNTNISIAQPVSSLAPEPSKPPPVQPAPPPPQLPEVPKVPSFASNQQPTSSAETTSRGLKDLSMDEQRSAWHERIEYAHIIFLFVD